MFHAGTCWLLRLSIHETSDTKYMNCSEVLLLACAKKLHESGLKPLWKMPIRKRKARYFWRQKLLS